MQTTTSLSLAGLAVLVAACAPASTPPTAAPSSSAAVAASPISAADLRTRLFAYADDSMQGREAGTVGDVRATAYIAREVQRLGLEPAGDDGGFFQTIPMQGRSVAEGAAVSLDGTPLVLWTDYAPLPSLGSFLPFGTSGSLDGAEVIYGGRLADSTVQLDPASIAGKIVLLSAPLRDGAPEWQIWMVGGLDRYQGAAAIAVATLDISPPGIVGFLRGPQTFLDDERPGAARPLGMLVTAAAAERLLGAPLDGAQPGTTGRTLSGTFRFELRPTAQPARNVVAILRGSDPVLRNEYVALGAHNDHVGMADSPLDHDLVWARMHVLQPAGADSPPRPPTAEDSVRITALLDSLHAVHPARLDSVYNGADDDGSGTIALLEIAQAFAAQPRRPKRSLLFVWHTAEEKGLYGSQYFTEHPTVPRSAIVAQLNIDMIGRGTAADVPGGGPGYLELIGSRRLSSELGDLVEAANREGRHGFTFDYQYDAEGHPSQFYCRSDHYQYARWGIPVVFFTTGSHADYHQLTDEAQYIDYAKMARVTELIMDIATRVADVDHRPVVDGAKPDPYGACVQ